MRAIRRAYEGGACLLFKFGFPLEVLQFPHDLAARDQQATNADLSAFERNRIVVLTIGIVIRGRMSGCSTLCALELAFVVQVLPGINKSTAARLQLLRTRKPVLVEELHFALV